MGRRTPIQAQRSCHNTPWFEIVFLTLRKGNMSWRWAACQEGFPASQDIFLLLKLPQ
jgi:hypothetical protein